MFSEIFLLKPRLDENDLNKLDKKLTGRFTKIAKSFGKGLGGVLLGGGITGIALGLIDKVLNPLKEVQDSIDKTLTRADDLSTFAKQFNTTSGKLARLQAFGTATGLDSEGVRLLLGKFQGAVAQAQADPTKGSAVSNFVGKQDVAEAFFEFIQSLKKLEPVQRNLVQQEVFGEKQILKASEFLNQDFAENARTIGGPSAEQLTQGIEKTAKFSDARDLVRAHREVVDIDKKSRLIKDKDVDSMLRGEKADLDRENKRLQSFDDLKKISLATDKLTKILEDGYLKLAPVLGQYLPSLIDSITTSAKVVEKSRAIRGMVPGAGKDK